MSAGRSREDIAFGVCESIVEKVTALAGRVGADSAYFLSGGLCESAYLRQRLSQTLKAPVYSSPDARYAGALGAAIAATFFVPGADFIRRLFLWRGPDR
jgi:activator of 2-hydroxyglutaryl-CoA dehydratase